MSTQQTPIKRYSELNVQQQVLYVKLGDLLESFAKENNLNNKEGIRHIFETLITLTVAMKALYLMTATPKDNSLENKDDASQKKETENDNKS